MSNFMASTQEPIIATTQKQYKLYKKLSMQTRGNFFTNKVFSSKLDSMKTKDLRDIAIRLTISHCYGEHNEHGTCVQGNGTPSIGYMTIDIEGFHCYGVWEHIGNSHL